MDMMEAERMAMCAAYEELCKEMESKKDVNKIMIDLKS